MVTHQFDTIGTYFEITVWDAITAEHFEQLCQTCEAISADFDALYSRFRADSLITKLFSQTGRITVPTEMVEILRLYSRMSDATGGALTPTIGVALEDAGYDAQYSLVERAQKRPVPTFAEALEIVDDATIVLHTPTLLDFGALGKGYLIDKLYTYLQTEGIKRFLVNGSGDIRYCGAGVPITAALEHPLDTTKAIGTIELIEGALCASATNRRVWGEGRHHYIDPVTGMSPQAVRATWVYAKTAAEADGLSSALFFVSPEQLSDFAFEYLILDKDVRATGSVLFQAGLFTKP